MADEV